MMAEREMLMATTSTVLSNSLRSRYSAMIVPHLEELGETVLCVGNGKFAIPCTNDDGDDAWVTISLTVPKGTRDGDAYDGYAESADYARHQQEQAEKKAEAERIRAQKQAERERKKAEKEAAKAAKQAEVAAE